MAPRDRDRNQTTQHTEGPESCDVAVITILDEVWSAVTTQMGLQSEVLRSGRTYWWGTVAGRNGDGSHVVVCGQPLYRSNIPAESFTTAFLHDWTPTYLIVADIGGGIKSKDGPALGDVVIGEALHYYEFAKIDEGKEEPRFFPVAPPSPMLCDIARAVGRRPDAIWGGRGGGQADQAMRLGEIAVGEKLLGGDESDPRLLGLLERYPKVQAVDMESIGIAYAVRDATTSGIHTDFLVLRGISDYCNAPGNQVTRDRWKPYVADLVATATHETISATPCDSLGGARTSDDGGPGELESGVTLSDGGADDAIDACVNDAIRTLGLRRNGAINGAACVAVVHGRGLPDHTGRGIARALRAAGVKVRPLPARIRPFDHAENAQMLIREATHVLYCCRADEDTDRWWAAYIRTLARDQDKPFGLVPCV